MHKLTRLACFLAAALVVVPPAHAAIGTTALGGTPTGEPLFPISLEVQQQAQQAPPPPSPEQLAAALAKDLGIGVSEQVTVNTFAFSGNSGLTGQELADVVKQWQARPIGAIDLVQALEAIRNRYRMIGYAFIDARIPPQQIAGALRIELLEGHVASIRVTGNNRYSAEFLANRISDLAPGKVITMAAFQRSIILLNTLPGLTAQIAPSPAAPGRFDINVSVKEKPFKAVFAPDNNIRSQFGNVQMRLTMDVNNVTKHGDTLTFEPAALQRKWPSGFRIGYNRPLNNKGTTLNLLFIKADFQFIQNTPLMGLQNNISYTVATVTHPLKMSFNRNIFVTAGYLHVTSAYVFDTTQFGDTEKLDAGMVSVVLAEGQAGKAQTNAFAQFVGNFRRNPDGLRNNAQQARLDVAAGHERWFDPNTSIFVFGIGVLSKDPLISSQKVTIGGPFCVRGFDVNEAQGDQGYLVKGELRRVFNLPRKTPLMVKAMLDHGGVYRQVPDPFFPSPTLETHLVSGGLGVNVKLQEKFYMSAEWAHRLNDYKTRDGRSSRWWLSATATF